MLRAILAAFFVCVSLSAQPRFDAAAMLRLERLSDPKLSPDGKLVAYTVTRVDQAANKKFSDIYLLPVSGGEPAALTTTGDNSRPIWVPDSKEIAFLSSRDCGSQIWFMAADGSNQRQFTNFPTEAEGHLFSPDGRYLVFVSSVYPSCEADAACNQAKLDAEKNAPTKARIYTSLLYRHWNEWRGERRKHLFQVMRAMGDIRDLTPAGLETPPFSLGGPDDYAIAPDGGEVVFTANPDPTPATSTNNELYVTPAYPADLSAGARKITVNLAADSSPQYSPDGRFLAWRSQSRPGYESDRWRLIVRDRESGLDKDLTEAIDRSVLSFTWTPDSSRIFYTTEDRARNGLNMISAEGGAARIILQGPSQADDVQLTPDGRTMIFAETTSSRPTELFRVSSSGGAPQQLTHLNGDRLAAYQLRPAEEFWVKSHDDARIQNLMVKPPGFSESKRYPLLLLIHGGPQGAWGHTWSYRWNAQVFANAGFVVVMPNPRGSTGYGTTFTDAINQDWSGKVYDDLMAVTAYVEKLPYIDGERMVAAGGSFGGYMVNWILGHDQCFRALISHAGVYDLPSMFGETEELWFPLWEFGGPPWDRPDVYERHSPSQHVRQFQTPTLVIHGELDYRVPVGQGLQLFTALQSMRVPSKLLLFPDEGHWILKPQNSLLWYRAFLDWAKQWIERPQAPLPVTQ